MGAGQCDLYKGTYGDNAENMGQGDWTIQKSDKEKIDMNSFELFTMIFFTLDAYWDEHKGEELGNFLSGMNPFLFEGEGSAISNVYSEFCAFLDDMTITKENSYSIAKEYVYSLDKD